MSVKLRVYRTGGWEVDVRVQFATGETRRVRKKGPCASKTANMRWGDALERELFARGPNKPRKESPTLRIFAPLFLDGYARANRQKPSGIASKETILRVHLLPQFETKKLDTFSEIDIQRLKSRLAAKTPKTVNNVLTVLNTLLKTAVTWGVIERMPCVIGFLKTPQPSMGFHDVEEFERLVESAQRLDPRTELIVLLGGEAGLRCGEMLALEWADVDLARSLLCVERSEWKGHVSSPKGGTFRRVPLTRRLATALRQHRHLQGTRVLCRRDGQPVTQKIVRELVKRASRRAHLTHDGVHILRHTFCSHLSMRGAPARAIQELAGHQNLRTTERYLHLSPTATQSAIALLNQRTSGSECGEMVETCSSRKRIPFR
jgi:integrase